MSWTTNYLRFMGVATVGFGAISLFSPATLSDPAGFGALSPSAVTDVRATYGGMQLGTGLFLLWASQRPEVSRIALALLAVSIACIGLSRGFGMLVDGSANGFHLLGISTELGLALVSVLALRSAERSQSSPARSH